MPISEHLHAVRAKLGHDLLMQPAVTVLFVEVASLLGVFGGPTSRVH